MKDSVKRMFWPRIDAEQEAALQSSMLSALRGDQHAYHSLLKEITVVIRRYLRGAVRSGLINAQRMEELVQEVLLAIHMKRHTYRPELPLMPWIYGIVRYRFIDYLRSDSRRPRFSEMTSELESQLGAAPTQEIQPFVQGTAVAELLRSLNAKQREVLILAKVDEVPVAEIGTRLSMSSSAVKVTIHRALAALRRRMEVVNEDA